MAGTAGGTDLAESIRGVLLAHHQEKVAQDTELLLMFASRAQHVQQVISPALKNNKWVICSRFSDSSMAYQGYGRGIDLSHIENLKQLAHPNVTPDLTLLFDLPVEVGLERGRIRGDLDRIEIEKQAFFEKVRRGYLQIAQKNPRIQVIDASGSVSEVCKGIQVVLDHFLKTHVSLSC